MRTEVMFDYKYKIFSSGQLKQFALKLARFCDMPTSDSRIFLHRREAGFETSTQSTIDKLDTNLRIGTIPESLGFHYKGHIIILSLKNENENIHVTYILDCDIEYSKKLIFFIENTLSLTRLSEQEASMAIFDDCQSIGQTQMDSDHGKVLQKNESTDLLIDVWQKASKQLQSLYSAAAYENWIAPLVPSVDGNNLVLTCPNEFYQAWLESRYKKAIIEMVLSIDSTVEGIIVKFSDKETNLSNETTNNHFLPILI
ncbi:DnaA N-terminal domain-containing protein [Desulfosporosinus sp. FKB]|uniref:DnaA N-terminal domain-containing protein n=1 Tax=Desulfosporosinus sp. FKB TaxID=1969835 RepID=UPI000B49BF98|nr:DnaA N-terminal domain-containing protein [Desulfosporosinus sp. FKB]